MIGEWIETGVAVEGQLSKHGENPDSSNISKCPDIVVAEVQSLQRR
jgi:hypothetical protein